VRQPFCFARSRRHGIRPRIHRLRQPVAGLGGVRGHRDRHGPDAHRPSPAGV
ncbi:MAG: hypothetical protein AVDCRST_MAG57-2497, partial [uncultured Blastococcus sp.]